MHLGGTVLQMVCHCIHNWFESPRCRLPGEPYTKLPLTCPADFVFDMPKLYEGLIVMGRRINIREYSFLDNPRTAPEVKVRTPLTDTPHPCEVHMVHLHAFTVLWPCHTMTTMSAWALVVMQTLLCSPCCIHAE